MSESTGNSLPRESDASAVSDVLLYHAADPSFASDYQRSPGYSDVHYDDKGLSMVAWKPDVLMSRLEMDEVAKELTELRWYGVGLDVYPTEIEGELYFSRQTVENGIDLQTVLNMLPTIDADSRDQILKYIDGYFKNLISYRDDCFRFDRDIHVGNIYTLADAEMGFIQHDTYDFTKNAAGRFDIAGIWVTPRENDLKPATTENRQDLFEQDMGQIINSIKAVESQHGTELDKSRYALQSRLDPEYRESFSESL